jgi:hypothetical protein
MLRKAVGFILMEKAVYYDDFYFTLARNFLLLARMACAQQDSNLRPLDS